jgi:hypothetical protein
MSEERVRETFLSYKSAEKKKHGQDMQKSNQYNKGATSSYSSSRCNNSHVLFLLKLDITMSRPHAKHYATLRRPFLDTKNSDVWLTSWRAVIAQSVERLGYGLDDPGSRVRFPVGAGNFSLHHRIQNGSGAHPASYPMGARRSLLGGKAAGMWSWPLTSI